MQMKNSITALTRQRKDCMRLRESLGIFILHCFIAMEWNCPHLFRYRRFYLLSSEFWFILTLSQYDTTLSSFLLYYKFCNVKCWCISFVYISNNLQVIKATTIYFKPPPPLFHSPLSLSSTYASNDEMIGNDSKQNSIKTFNCLFCLRIELLTTWSYAVSISFLVLRSELSRF